jgi:hypothetical protein
MMNRLLLSVALLMIGYGASAQMHTGSFSAGWMMTTPLSDKEFVDEASPRGFRVNYVKFMDDHLAFGADVSYTTLDSYVPRRTYYYDGGAITTDVYNYMYYLTLGAQAQYYFLPDKRVNPFASVSSGIAFTQYKIFYNVYSNDASETSFFVRPEAGVAFLLNERKTLGLKTTFGYEMATNKSKDFDVKNFSALNFQIGVIFFLD